MSIKELVLIPTPAAGHMVSAVQFAKQLIENDKRLAVTILIIKPPYELPAAAAASHEFNHPDIKFIQLPQVNPPRLVFTESIEKFVSDLIQSHKSHVKDAILEHVVSKSIPLAGIIVDMFCTSMIDVANELGVPSYVFYTSAAFALAFLLYLPIHSSKTGREFFIPSDSDSIIPSFAEPFPSRFLPSFAFNKDGYSTFVSHVRKFKEARGIIINTFAELEADTIKSLESQLGITKIYTIGPLINHGEKKILDSKREDIISWLDEQPPSSVIYLCFGSNGGFQPAQLVEIATALEKSRQRFLWSIQKPPLKDFSASSREYTDFSEVLPEGFLERTKNRGLVCGWAPQVEVLSDKAVGGFVSHCGWNSILESLWYGVPIAAWPLYAEQHLNAFQFVKDMGLAVEVKLDFRMEDGNMVVPNDEIEKAITSLMDAENPVRKKVKEISDLSRQATSQRGSSFISMESFVVDILAKSSLQ